MTEAREPRLPLLPRLSLYAGGVLGLYFLAAHLAERLVERLHRPHFLGEGDLFALLPELLTIQTGLWGLGCLLLTLLFWRVLDRRQQEELGLRLPRPREFGLAVLLGLGPLAAVLPVYLLTGHHRIEGFSSDSPQLIAYRIGVYGALALAVGLAEEIPFRGYLLPNLAERWGETAGTLLTSLAFLAAHLAHPAYHQPLNILNVLLVGAALAWLRLGTGSLVLPLLTHALYDFGLFILVGDPEMPGVLRTTTAPANLWLGGAQSAGLLDTAVTLLWADGIRRWVYGPSREAVAA